MSDVKQTGPAPLRGRVALVTGGGRGIGRAAALALARRGAAVAVLARSAGEVSAVAATIEAGGGRALGLAVDIGDAPAVRGAAEQVAEALGPVDILINNAAVVAPLGPLAASDVVEWEAALRVNLLGSYLCLRAVLPGMLGRGWGRVVNVSSGAATGRGLPHAGAYSVSKAGLDMLTRVTAAEVEGSGVTLNALYPGVVDTRMQADIREAPPEQIGAAMAERFGGFHERGELRGPDEPAELIVAIVLSDLSGETVSIGTEQADALLGALRLNQRPAGP